MAENVHFLTPEGKAKLEKELERLKKEKRPQVAANLKAAIQEGDISENAGYEESKREQAFVEGRIREIENILANVEIVEESEPHGAVDVGSRVTITEQGVSERETYQIVGSAEADPSEGRISNVSPLGKALMGNHVGDEIQVETPAGTLSFEIISIE
jgi:transcription elongation factor GreA